MSPVRGCATSNEVARPTESDVPPVGGWGLWPTFRHTESIKETSEMAKVTITVGTDKRLARATCEHDDEAQALASCIYRIAETSPSDRVAWIGDAVYRLMRGEPEPTR